jgi:anti-anti-sigma factor
MKSHIQHKGDVAVINLMGTINGGKDCERLRAMVEDLAAGGTRRIVINFALIRFITSCGLGALIGCKKHMLALGGNIVMCNLDSRPVSVIHKMRLYEFFQVTGNLNEALELVASDAPVPVPGG